MLKTKQNTVEEESFLIYAIYNMNLTELMQITFTYAHLFTYISINKKEFTKLNFFYHKDTNVRHLSD